jgi:hypothetical protein
MIFQNLNLLLHSQAHFALKTSPISTSQVSKVPLCVGHLAVSFIVFWYYSPLGILMPPVLEVWATWGERERERERERSSFILFGYIL